MVAVDRNTGLIIVGIVAYVVALGMFFGQSGPPEPGEVGSDHAHLYFAVTVDGERIDFSQEQYQLADRRVHFENNDGEILHVHAERVTVAYTLETLGMEINDTCLRAGQARCSNATHDLRVYVDGEVIDEPDRHIVDQDENVMVWYGPEDSEPDDAFFRRVLPSRFRPGTPGNRV